MRQPYDGAREQWTMLLVKPSTDVCFARVPKTQRKPTRPDSFSSVILPNLEDCKTPGEGLEGTSLEQQSSRMTCLNTSDKGVPALLADRARVRMEPCLETLRQSYQYSISSFLVDTLRRAAVLLLIVLCVRRLSRDSCVRGSVSQRVLVSACPGNSEKPPFAKRSKSSSVSAEIQKEQNHEHQQGRQALLPDGVALFCPNVLLSWE